MVNYSQKHCPASDTLEIIRRGVVTPTQFQRYWKLQFCQKEPRRLAQREISGAIPKTAAYLSLTTEALQWRCSGSSLL